MITGKTRIKDIAILAGVSIGTVDRVLHDRGEVAEKTRQRIRRILKETNYSPNVMAQVLKSRKGYNLISLLPEPSRDNAFWEKHAKGINRALEELDLFNLSHTRVTFDMFNEEDFQRKAKEVLDLKPDGVLLAPIFKTESVAFCRRLSEIKIPFVFVDGFIEDTDFMAYIGEDIFKSGRVAGQLTEMITPEKGEILIVSITRNIENVHHLNNRKNGFLSYFKNSPISKDRIINIVIPSPSLKDVRAALDTSFFEHPGIRSIFVSGSKSYLIASYLEEKGFENVNLIGYDLLDKNVKYLKIGILKFLIGQRPEEQTYKGIRKLFEFLSLNKIPERMEYLPVDIITSENIDFYVSPQTLKTEKSLNI